MSNINSSADHLTFNADGAGKEIKFQANGVEKASIDSSGNFTSTSIDATKLSGTVPNFTSTGIDDNATSTAITINASENVGIGTTAPTEKLDVTGNIKASGTFKGSVAAPTLFTYNHVGSLSPTPTAFTTRTALMTAGLVDGGVYIFTAFMDSYLTGITGYSLRGVTKPWIFSTRTSNHTSIETIGSFIWQGHAYYPTVTIHYRFELGTSGAD